MAVLIPNNLASRSDVPSAVQEVARAFRDLVEDDVTVVYELGEDTSPLVVVDPLAGALVVHVVEGGLRGLKGGRFRNFASLLGLRDEMSGQCEVILDRLARSAHVQRKIPVGSTRAVPTVAASTAERDGYDPEELLLKDHFTAERLRDAVAARLTGGIRPFELTEERATRAAVTPEIVIHDRKVEDRGTGIVFRPPEEEGDALAVLDRRQHNLAMHLGEGYRVVRGVAGSGKTLVLTFRAKHLAEDSPGRRFLLTCYNVMVSKALEEQLAEVPNVEVATIDSVVHRVLRQEGRYVKGGDDEAFRRRRKLAREVLADGYSGDRYDAVLVDEAQDFDISMLDVAHGLLTDPEADFVIALDGAQNIRRTRHRWNPPGMTARGRTTILRRNYRNTHEILDLAYGLLLRGGAEEAPEDIDVGDPDQIVPPEASSRRGVPPEVVACRSGRDEVEAVMDRIETWHEKGTAWSDMLILYGTKWLQGKLWYQTEQRDIPYVHTSHTSKSKREVLECGDAVRCSNLHSIKGLEFSRVLLCGVNNVWVPGAEDGEDDFESRRLLYVAMTRAMDRLFVTVSGDGAVGRDLLELAD